MILKYTPRLSFELDTSIAEGDRVLALLSKIEPPAAEEPPAGGGEPDATQQE